MNEKTHFIKAIKFFIFSRIVFTVIPNEMMVSIRTLLPLALLLVTQTPNSNGLTREANHLPSFDCLTPVYPVEFINVYLFDLNSLSMVLLMSLCTIPGSPNNKTVYFRISKCSYDGDAISAEAFYPYAVLDTYPVCSINIIINRLALYESPESDKFIFNDDQIKMWSNTSSSEVLQWTCNHFPRSQYEPLLKKAFKEMLIYNYQLNSTVPFVKIVAEKPVETNLTIVYGVIVVGAVCGLLILVKIMKH